MFPIGLNAFTDIFTVGQAVIYAAMSVINAVLIFYASMKFMLVLQASGYKGKRYFKWLKNPDTPYMSRLMLLCLLGLLFFCVLAMTFSFAVGDAVASFIGFASYLLFTSVYIYLERKVNAKASLKRTKRLVRMCILFAFLLLAISFGTIILLDYIAFLINDRVFGILRYAIICAMPILSPFILYLSCVIMRPLEEKIKKYYVRIAKQKLSKAEVIKIGITGSFAKTSVKIILRDILSVKYRVLASPESYNTPMGIAMTIASLDNTYDVFIAELGARHKGDIKELTDMIEPDIGVLTGINCQHLETFGSIENIIDTKNELFVNMKKDGVAFFSSDNLNSEKLFENETHEKYLAGLNEKENSRVFATDVTINRYGTSFTLNIKDKEPIKCSTVLLGRHSIGNICLAAAVAEKLGLTGEEIALGISRIQSVRHRLEIVPNNKEIVIIDDSYNCNVDGIGAAMETLDTFTGRKIVLTPGLVELGREENIENVKFGRILAKHADKVIIVGNHNAETLLTGLLEGGMKKEDVIFAKNTGRGNEELNEIMEKGDVILFENDLPDTYN